MTRAHTALALAAATLGTAACVLRSAPAPDPARPLDLVVLDAVVARVRAHPPHRGFPLVIAPATVRREPDRYPLTLRPEFAGALSDLERRGAEVAPVTAAAIGDVFVQREGVYDPYDLTQYLLVRLSTVGFSADSTRAAVLVVFDCGPGCGSQSGFGLRRNGVRWRVTQVRPITVAPPPDPGGQQDGGQPR